LAWLRRENADQIDFGGGDGGQQGNGLHWIDCSDREVALLLKYEGPEARLTVQLEQGGVPSVAVVRWDDTGRLLDAASGVPILGAIKRRQQRG
jgi:hypothetical protein